LTFVTKANKGIYENEII